MVSTVALSLENEAFRAYAFWSAILCAKMLLMSTATAVLRAYKGVVISSEDTAFSVLLGRKIKVTPGVEIIERVRRSHRNDLENILVFLIAGFVYLLTDPTAWVAINIFRVIGVARIAYSVIYSTGIRGRGLPFASSYFLIIYLSAASLYFYL